MSNNEHELSQPRKWVAQDMPILYTPINSIEILQQKRLTIAVLVQERTKTKPDCFGYINVPLKEITHVE